MEVKQIPNFKDYFADQEGNIYSNKSGHLKRLSPRKGNKDRYYTVVLYDGTGKKKSMLIHRLVAYTFLGYPEDSNMQINHKNFNRYDNSVSNLEWVTPSENMKHHDSIRGKRTRGKFNGNSKLNVKTVQEILENKDNLSQRKLAKKYGVTQSAIWNVINRKTWNDFSIELSSKDNNE